MQRNNVNSKNATKKTSQKKFTIYPHKNIREVKLEIKIDQEKQSNKLQQQQQQQKNSNNRKSDTLIKP